MPPGQLRDPHPTVVVAPAAILHPDCLGHASESRAGAILRRPRGAGRWTLVARGYRETSVPASITRPAGSTASVRLCCPAPEMRCQAQLEPTALSVLAMLLPALCTFCPWALACS